MSSPATDVVVTGLGATTPLGGDVASTWDALLAGRSGVSRITDDWIKEFPAQLVARLANDPVEKIDRVRARRLDRSQQVAVVAAEEAWEQSGAADAGVDAGAHRGRLRHRHRRRADAARPGRRPRGEGTQAGLPVHHPDAHAQRPGRRRRARRRREGRRARAGQRLRVGRRGDPLGPGPAAVRPRRRGAGRRHRGLRAPAAHGRLRGHAGDVHPQRRARARLPPVRQGRRRLRAGRGRGGTRPRARGRRQGTRRPGPRPPGRCRRHRRRLRPGRAAPRGRGRGPRHRGRAARRRPGPRPTSATSTRTPPRPRSATPPRRRRSAARSASTYWSPPPRARPATCSARPARSSRSSRSWRSASRSCPATANLDDPDDDAAVQALDIVRGEARRATSTPRSTTPSASAATTSPWCSPPRDRGPRCPQGSSHLPGPSPHTSTSAPEAPVTTVHATRTVETDVDPRDPEAASSGSSTRLDADR